MIKAEQLGAKLRRAALRIAVVLRAHEEPAPRPFLGRVRQRKRRRHGPLASIQRAAAFIGIGLDAMLTDGVGDTCLKGQRHQAPSSQKRSERYFSPPSQNTTTTTASDAFRATRSAPTRLAPLEIPTKSPSRASRLVSSNASSVLTPMSS